MRDGGAPMPRGLRVMTIAWWIWLVIGTFLAGTTAFLAFLSLSAGSAYGANYHSLSPRQRVMGRLLYLGSLIGSLVCAASGAIAVLLAVRAFFAGAPS
jgi:hypothetical protein